MKILNLKIKPDNPDPNLPTWPTLPNLMFKYTQQYWMMSHANILDCSGRAFAKFCMKTYFCMKTFSIWHFSRWSWTFGYTELIFFHVACKLALWLGFEVEFISISYIKTRRPICMHVKEYQFIAPICEQKFINPTYSTNDDSVTAQNCP